LGVAFANCGSEGTDGAFRVIYVARFEDAIHVLHCFQKKTAKTAAHDITFAAQRYRDLERDQLR